MDGIYFIFLKQRPRPNMKGFQYQIWTFRYGFKDRLNPLCACGTEVETIEHFLFPCQLHSTHWSELFGKIVKVDHQFFNLIAKIPVLMYYMVHKKIILQTQIKFLLLNTLNQLVVLTDQCLTPTNKFCVFLVVKIFVFWNVFIAGCKIYYFNIFLTLKIIFH